jgi:hypothetical protein
MKVISSGSYLYVERTELFFGPGEMSLKPGALASGHRDPPRKLEARWGPSELSLTEVAVLLTAVPWGCSQHGDPATTALWLFGPLALPSPRTSGHFGPM